jgi:hypothetical protein
MTYPNPAGYYLPLPEAFETEVVAMGKNQLTQFLDDLASHLNRDHEEFEFDGVFTSLDFDDLINLVLKESDLIALIRWVAECLSWLASQEKVNDAKP